MTSCALFRPAGVQSLPEKAALGRWGELANSREFETSPHPKLTAHSTFAFNTRRAFEHGARKRDDGG